MDRRNIPNLITALRILLVAPLLWCLVQGQYAIALLLFLVAGLSDGLDGYLAKHYGWTTRLGGVLDPIADKLLLVGTILVLGWAQVLPLWLVVLVILRDVVIVCGALAYHLLVEPFQAAPLLASKLNTLAQLTLVLSAIVAEGVWPLPQPLIALMIYVVAFTTILSGTWYVLRWGAMAVHKWRRGRV